MTVTVTVPVPVPVPVPVTTTAVLEVPLVGGRQVRAPTGALLVLIDDQAAHYAVGSGRWTFRVRR